MSIVYLNGQFIPQEKATISVMDRGFLFGDGVYEVIPVFDSNFFGIEEHLDRLDRSLSAINMTNPLSHDEWKALLSQLVSKNDRQIGSYSCYCQVTRGADSTRSHMYPDDLQPTVVAFLTTASAKPLNQLAQGFKAITLDDSRRRDCYIKAITLLPNILNMQEAKSRGAIEAILIRNNEVVECTSSNIFIVKNGEILTPPLSENILSGVTRGIVLALAHQNNIPAKETKITPDMLMDADEVWVTGSTKEICPIIEINDQMIGDGQTGPLWKVISQAYNDYKDARKCAPQEKV